MPHSLACLLTPHGALRLEAAEDDIALDASVAERLEATFRKGDGHGLLQLGLAEAGSRLPPDLGFWRAFAIRFVAACAKGEGVAEAARPAAPAKEALKTLVEEAPPMRGGEYLDPGRLAALWEALAQAFEMERSESGLSVGAFLASRDSRWRQVGRVHLNLAENRKDAERPFAFLATYASSLAAHGALRHAPLGAALREYAGAGANDELLKLLEPVSRAAESCPWLKAIVDSGEIFHPLRWTPQDAMRLLSDVEPLEQAGVVVRMPASWRTGRPSRPAVEATVGSNAPSQVGAAQLLDLQVDVSLDGAPLTPDEISSLLAATDGLALLRGQWVEVDAARLKATLDRYAEIERLARKQGVSFGQAMRLLAGVDVGASEATQAAEASWAHVTAGPWLTEALAACRSPETLAAVHQGEALRATLRPYQDVGLRWLGFLARLGLGACLADDMGLGKTIQVLALLLTISERSGEPRPSLIVAPASIIANWAAEAKRFAPSLNLFVAHPAFTPAERLKSTSAEDLAGIDLVVTSYAALLR